MIECGFCGGQMSKNPHPDAGKPEKLLEAGAEYVCIPCQRRSMYITSGFVLNAKLKIRAETAREIFEEIGLDYDEDDELVNYPTAERWQALKSKYGGER